MSTYFALTIGPIYDTISSARTTREMWASSYLFSYIVRQLVEQFDHAGMEILLPLHTESDLSEKHGAGIYPDRIIAKMNSCTKQSIETIIDDTVEQFSLNIYQHLNSRNDVVTHSFNVLQSDSAKKVGIQDGIKDYLLKYIRLYYLAKELNKGDNISKNLYPYLDVMDLQPRILPPENFPDSVYFNKQTGERLSIKTSPLRVFTDLINNSFLIEDGFGKKEHIKSLNEIATVELQRIDGKRYGSFQKLVKEELTETWQLANAFGKKSSEKRDKEEEAMNELRKNFTNEFKAYHNYIAIVQADGDNIGAIIKQMNVADNKGEFNQENNLKTFSKMLSSFSDEATKLVVKYGGTPVYMGGDDIFFFAPVACRKDKNSDMESIFDLVDILNKKFIEEVRDPATLAFNPDIKPSLSFGISVTYRKFPLYEARNIAYNLMKKAKEVPDKNTVAITLLKASGHDISFMFAKDEPDIFNKIIEMTHTRVNTKENFINSITYKLDSLKKVLVPVSGDKERVKNFFKNNFNENYKDNKSFYESLEEFIVLLANKNKPSSILNDEDYKLLYGVLRFIHFLRSNEKE